MKRLVSTSIIITLFSAAILCYWFAKSYNANSSEFDHSVSVALMTVADTMSERASLEKRSPNLFYVTTNSPVLNETVDTLINRELSIRNIKIDYELCIYNAQDDTLIYGNAVNVKESPLIPEKSCEITDGINKNFAVRFPTRNSYVLGKSDVWILITFLMIVVSWSYYELKNKARVDYLLSRGKIKLGNSCLDYHNQSIDVHKETYRLTHKESQILKLLFERPNQVIDRDIFLENIWKKDGFFVARSMDVFISKVRKYLNSDETIKIENLRSIGYRLNVRKK